MRISFRFTYSAVSEGSAPSSSAIKSLFASWSSSSVVTSRKALVSSSISETTIIWLAISMPTEISPTGNSGSTSV